MKETVLNNDTTTKPEGFAKLGIAGALLKATNEAGFIHPKPIQAKAIPAMLDRRDVLGVAQTGSGKTAAFALPILSQIAALDSRPARKTARALVLAPTRELAVQIEEAVRLFSKGARISTALVLGGMSRGAQVKKVASGVDVLVATPGRLIDLLRERDLDLSQTAWLVLDEADRMLDMGFINDVRKIARATHPQRQTAMFSATMPAEIVELANGLLRDPLRVEAAPQGTAAAEIEQSVVMARTKQKRQVLAGMLADEAMGQVLVFARTKHGADRVTRDLGRDGFEAAVIHGNKSQNARQRALNGFRDGSVRILVATDIAARGIDVPGISHVVNFDLPAEAESYVHRIGRTGRNGAAGSAITLCDPSETQMLRQIERLVRTKLPVAASHLGDPDPVRSAADREIAANDDRRDAEAERRGNGNGRSFRGKPNRANTGHAKPNHAKTNHGHGVPYAELNGDRQAQKPRIEGGRSAGEHADKKRFGGKRRGGFGKGRTAARAA